MYLKINNMDQKPDQHVSATHQDRNSFTSLIQTNSNITIIINKLHVMKVNISYTYLLLFCPGLCLKRESVDEMTMK